MEWSEIGFLAVASFVAILVIRFYFELPPASTYTSRCLTMSDTIDKKTIEELWGMLNRVPEHSRYQWFFECGYETLELVLNRIGELEKIVSEHPCVSAVLELEAAYDENQTFNEEREVADHCIQYANRCADAMGTPRFTEWPPRSKEFDFDNEDEEDDDE